MYFRGSFVHRSMYVCMELGQQAVPSIERCPSFRVVFIERFYCILNQDIVNYSSRSA